MSPVTRWIFSVAPTPSARFVSVSLPSFVNSTSISRIGRASCSVCSALTACAISDPPTARAENGVLVPPDAAGAAAPALPDAPPPAEPLPNDGDEPALLLQPPEPPPPPPPSPDATVPRMPEWLMFSNWILLPSSMHRIGLFLTPWLLPKH